jgi:hypothetical protein
MTPDMPRALVYGASVTCGVLVALAAHILLGGAGLHLSGLWRPPTAAGPEQLRWALAWWVIAGAGFVSSWLTVRMLRDVPRRHRLSARDWLLAGGFVVLLASAGRGGGAGAGAVAQSVLASVVAMGLAGLASVLGAYFALRR